jgi:hypothetical protein
LINSTSLLAEALQRSLLATWQQTFGEREAELGRRVANAAMLIIERIGNSDALYHDAHHTAMVTLVGQAILRGKLIAETVTPNDWLHVTLAMLTHDIGYVRGICPGDTAEVCVVDGSGATVAIPRGASDAFLAPYHVDRAKLAVRSRFADLPEIDGERIAAAIELTRFPYPETDDRPETGTEAGLVRAADLIGQLGDPLYPRKLGALFYEFAELGIATQLGYQSPADLAEKYPKFFWERVEPYIGDAMRYLEFTMEGKQWIANLNSHIFVMEHNRSRLGPQPGPATAA